MNRELMEVYNSQAEAIERESDAARKNAEKSMQAKNDGKEMRMLMRPKYEADPRLNCQRETDKPPTLIYEELGWDRTPGEGVGEKHYRRFVDRELEHATEVMSRPSEFNCYEIKRGQTRGASGGFSLFGGPKTEQATGEADTTTKMGIFKALITVAHKDTMVEKQMFMMRKLTQIREKLALIYEKRFKKEFPIPSGFFCETSFEGSKVMTAAQRERAYSDEIKAPTLQETREANALTGQNKGFSAKVDALATSRSAKTFRFDARASTILNPEGRALFRELMASMKLTHLQIMRKIVDVQSDEIIKRLLMQEQKCSVRVYIVRAYNLAARDNDSPSDPYVKLILGDQERGDRDNYKTDDADPDIYEMFEF